MSVPVPWRINLNEGNTYDQMLKNATDKMRLTRRSKFFTVDSVNIFTDAGKSSDGTRLSTVANCIANVTKEGVTARLSNVVYIEDVSTAIAELSAIYYGLITYNSEKIYAPVVRIFTDSTKAVSILRPLLLNINTLRKDPILLREYLDSLNNDKNVQELIYMICEERALINSIVNIYHIKSHTSDTMLIMTRFKQFNGIDIDVYDAIELSTYHSFVDNKVNKSLRISKEMNDKK